MDRLWDCEWVSFGDDLRVGCKKTQESRNAEKLKSETLLSIKKRKNGSHFCEPFLYFGRVCGDRTHDKRIKSPLLYQLS